MKNSKTQKFSEPGLWLSALILAGFAALTWFLHRNLAYAEAGAAVLLGIYALIRSRQRNKQLQALITGVKYSTESATNRILSFFPLPVAVFRLRSNNVVWANRLFWEMVGVSEPSREIPLEELVPSFRGEWLIEGKTRMAQPLRFGSRTYEVCGSMMRQKPREKAAELLAVACWTDVTEHERLKKEFHDTRPAAMVILVDNYDDMMKPLTDRQRTELRSRLDDAMERWSEGRNSILRRTDRDTYLVIMERRELDELVESRFPLVESIHSIVNTTGIHATVSIGVGVDGKSYQENYAFAALATDMALSRGGDQAVVKDNTSFLFYGGRGDEGGSRTRTRSRVAATSLAHFIEGASRVYVMSHRFADMDSVGAAAGLACIARKKGVRLQIVLGDGCVAGPLLETLRRLEPYRDAFINAEEAILRADNRTVLIVVDTDRPEQVEDDSLLTACAGRLAVIDHHRRAATYIENPVLSLCEPSASSACELVTELMQELLEPQDILPEEADAVLSGIMLDTKSFTIRTGAHTFEAAAFLERARADSARVKRLFKNDMEQTMMRYRLMQQARFYKEIAVVASEETADRIVASQAADELLNISGVQASAVLYPMAAGGVAVSARSIGEINVQVLLEELGGGGNKSAAGAQIPDITMREAVNRLFAAIDRYMATE